MIYNWRKFSFEGYSLIMAIAVIIVITATALLFLSYFQMNYYFINNAESVSIARTYCYNGFSCLDQSSSYDAPLDINYPDGLQLKLIKSKWGAYDVYHSTVVKNSKDTLCNRIALIGYQKDTTYDLSLYLRKTNAIVTFGDSVFISGKCYVPSGYVKNFGKSFVPKERILASADTIVRVSKMDTIIQWAKTFSIDPVPKINCQDTIDASFNHKTILISADTVLISGCLLGNVIIRARHIQILPFASVNDIICIASSVSFPDNFKGQLQVYASDSIVIGNGVTFTYPTILCLLPEINWSQGQTGNHYYIEAGDSLTLSGEAYAYAYRYDLSMKTFSHFKAGTKITGSFFSTGVLQWEGICNGSIISEKLLNSNTGTAQANFLRNTTIDSVPSAFSYSTIFPYPGRQKIVSWIR